MVRLLVCTGRGCWHPWPGVLAPLAGGAGTPGQLVMAVKLANEELPQSIELGGMVGVDLRDDVLVGLALRTVADFAVTPHQFWQLGCRGETQT